MKKKNNMVDNKSDMMSTNWIKEMAKAMQRQYDKESDLLCEMANFLHSRHTELPSNIWVSVKNASHGPRIKIQKNKGIRMQIENTFSMTISDSPEIVGEAGNELSTEDISYFKDFIIRNKQTLLDYWDGELDTSDLTENMEF